MNLDVLMVEDNPQNAKLANDLLVQGGHRVELAASGAELRALVPARPLPDVVLMDILLPDVEGPTLLAELRADPRWAAVPVIAVTAQAVTNSVADLTRAGFDAVILKPIDLNRFVIEVEHVVGRSRKKPH